MCCNSRLQYGLHLEITQVHKTWVIFIFNSYLRIKGAATQEVTTSNQK